MGGETDWYGGLSGTSMATPHVTGTWAALKSRWPSASVAEVLSALQATGVLIYDPGNGLGKPRIQVDAALRYLAAPAISVAARPGARIDGAAPGDWAGYSVASAGDVSGDGALDLVVGAPGADPKGRADAGAAYMLFGAPPPER